LVESRPFAASASYSSTFNAALTKDAISGCHNSALAFRQYLAELAVVVGRVHRAARNAFLYDCVNQGLGFMRQIIPAILLAAMAVSLISCGTNTSKFAPQPLPNISGAWELIAAPTINNGSTTGIELALKEGKSFDSTSGQYQPNGQISASGTQISFVGINKGGLAFGGNCPVAGPDTSGNNLVGTISGLGGSFNFTYNENGNDFTVTGTLNGDGSSMMGTYTSPVGSNCLDGDSGAVTGLLVSKLSGTYLGQLILPDGTSHSVSATLSEGSSAALSVNLVLADNTTLSLSGPVAGNFFSVQGTFQGQAVAYYGYYQATLSNSGILTQTLYVVNAATPNQLAGVLTVPLTQ